MKRERSATGLMEVDSEGGGRKREKRRRKREKRRRKKGKGEIDKRENSENRGQRRKLGGVSAADRLGLVVVNGFLIQSTGRTNEPGDGAENAGPTPALAIQSTGRTNEPGDRSL